VCFGYFAAVLGENHSKKGAVSGGKIGLENFDFFGVAMLTVLFEVVLVDDFIVEDLDEATPKYLSNRKKVALADSIIVNGFISKDGTTTMIFARLEAEANEQGDISAEVMKDIHAIIDPEAKKTGYKYWLNGGPPMTEAFVDIAGKDAMTFTPLVFLLSMVLLFLLFRRVSGALIPMAVVLFTFLSVLAVQTLLGYKLNNFTANIPVFIVAIGIADAVHIYSVWLMGKKEGLVNYEAVLKSLEKISLRKSATCQRISFKRF